MSRVAVVLSGCGHLDGAEIRESVLSLLYLDMQGAEVSVFAPDMPQYDVIDHREQVPENARRNVLAESARIARGDVSPLSELDHVHFDALLLPGGFGAAKNLSDFALKGADCNVLAQLQSTIVAFHDNAKPIGAMCIAPVLLAAALKGRGLTLTIGCDAEVASAIEALGHIHQNCETHSAVIDEANRIATCSAYMRDDSLTKVASGIEQVVQSMLHMVE